MNRKCSFERTVIPVVGWLTGVFIICIDQKNSEKQKTIRVLTKVEVRLFGNFFQVLRTSFYLFEKKKYPKGMHGNFWHSNASPFEYLSINSWVTGKYFLNPPICNPSEHDYTWSFKFSNLLFLHMAIVKLHSIYGKTSTFFQYFWRNGVMQRAKLYGQLNVLSIKPQHQTMGGLYLNHSE